MFISLNELHNEITKRLNSSASQPLKSLAQLDEMWLNLNALQALTQVEIASINVDASSPSQEQSVDIRNRGELTIDLSGWRITTDSRDVEYVFPKGGFLSPYETLKVKAQSNAAHSFLASQPIWNIRGGTATLWDSKGQQVSSIAYGDKVHADVMISYIHVDGHERRTEGDEFVEITNLSNRKVDVSNWKLIATHSHATFVFPPQSIIEPATSIKVFTNKSPLAINEYSFNSGKAIWNNQSGRGQLVDYQDREVSTYDY